MNYCGIIKNDVSAGEGVCTSFFVQGCPHHCPGCHNPESWDFDGGKEFTPDTLNGLLTAINANGIERNFCLMGGEPLCEQNAFLSLMILKAVREHYPNIKIYIWTGYVVEELKLASKKVKQCIELADYIIDGPFIQEQRDITLPMRGSKNQRILSVKDLNIDKS